MFFTKPSHQLYPIKYLKCNFAHFRYTNVQKQILPLDHLLCISCVSSDLGLVLVLDIFRFSKSMCISM